MKWVAVLLLIASSLIAECDWCQIFHCNYIAPKSEASGFCNVSSGQNSKVSSGCCNYATKKEAKIEPWRAPSCCNFVNAEYSKADCCCNYISGRESQAEGFGSFITGQKSHSDGCCLCVFADQVDMQDSFCALALEKFSDFPKSLCCEIGSFDGISCCCRPCIHEVIIRMFKKRPQSEKQKMDRTKNV